jgi:hypothetical protein
MKKKIYHKFKAKPQKVDNINFSSKLEANYYDTLKRRVSSGEVLFFLRQTGIDLPGGIRYFCDFLEFHADGTVHFIDCKGIETDVYKIKSKQLAELYPFQIEVVKKVPTLFTNRELDA